MPILNIPGAGLFRFPDTMSREEMFERALQIKADYETANAVPPPDPRDLGLGQLFMGAVGRAASSLGSLITDQLPAMGASFLGYEDYAKQQQAEAAEKQRAAQEKYPPAYPSYKNVRGIGDVPGYIAETAGEQLLNVLSILTGGGVGAGAARLALGTGRAGAGVAPGMAATSFAQQAPETFKGIYEETGKLEPGLAAVAGALQAALDTYIPGKIAKQFFGTKAARDTAIAELAKRSDLVPPKYKWELIKEAGKTAAQEGLTEAGQESISILAEQIAGSVEGLSPKNIDRLIDAALKGTIGGGIIGAPSAAVQAGRNVADVKAAIAQQQQPQEQQEQQEQAAPVPEDLEVPAYQRKGVEIAGLTPPLRAPRTVAPLPEGVTIQQVQQQIADAQTPARPSREVVPPEEGVDLDTPTYLRRQQAAAQQAAAQQAPEPAVQQEPDLADVARQMASVEPKPVTTTATATELRRQLLSAQEQVEKFLLENKNVSEVSPDLLKTVFGFSPPQAEAVLKSMESVGDVSPVQPNGARRVLLTQTTTTPKEPPSAPATTAAAAEKPVEGAGGAGVQTAVSPAAAAEAAPGVGGAERGAVGVGEQTAAAPAEGTERKPAALGSRERYWRPNPYEPNNAASWQDTFGQIHYDSNYKLPKGGRVTDTIDAVQSDEIQLIFINSKGEKKVLPIYTEKGRKPYWAVKDFSDEALKRQLGKNLYNVIGDKPLNTDEERDALIQKIRALVREGGEKQQPAEGAEGKPAALRTPESFAKDIAAGKKLETPEDVQFYQNNAPAIEAELKKLRETEKPEGEKPPAPQGKTAAPTPTVAAKYDPAIEKVRRIKTPPTKGQEAVRTYFDGQRSQEDALNLIAYDIAHPRARVEEEVQEAEDLKEVTYPRQTATAAQKWIDANASSLAPALRKKVAEKAAEYEKGTLYVEKFSAKQEKLTEKERTAQAVAQRRAEKAPARAEKKAIKEVTEQVEEAKAAPTEQEEARAAEREAIAAEKEAAEAKKEEQAFDLKRAEREAKAAEKAAAKGRGSKGVTDEEVEALLKQMSRGEFEAPAPIGKPVSGTVATALKNNDLNAALAELGKTDSRARALARTKPTAKVEVVKDLKNADGGAVPGLFDPATNTIRLDESTGLNDHTVIHEAAHAALSHTLDNPSHPTTKQLQGVFDKVAPELPTAYGSQNLQEFAAEAMSNPDFQQQLALMHPNGDPISAWQRFSRAVVNFMRRLMGMDARPIESALDATDRILLNALSPAPETRNAEALYNIPANPQQNADMLTRMANAARGLVGNRPTAVKRVATVHEVVNTVASGTKEQLLRLTDLYSFVELAKKYVPQAEMVAQLEQERQGAITSLMDSASPYIESLAKWANDNPNKYEAFSKLTTYSTIFRVNPTYDRATYKDSPEKLTQYDTLQQWYTAVGPSGQQQYKDLLKLYEEFRKKIEASLKGRLVEALVNNRKAGTSENEAKAAADKIANNLILKLTEGRIDPYVPLARKGAHGLSYNAPNEVTGNANEFYVQFFENRLDRDNFIAHLKQEGAENIRTFVQFGRTAYKDAPSTSFVGQMVAMLETNGVPEDVIENVISKYIDLLPESSILKSYQTRKDRLGAIEDPLAVMKDRIPSMAFQIGNIEYGANLNAVIKSARDEVEAKMKEAGAEDPTTNSYLKGLEERVRLINTPPELRGGRLANWAAYNMLLGFNLSSGLLQFAQVPMVVLPRLGGKYGYDEASKALLTASKIFLNSGTSRIVKRLGDDAKISVGGVSRSLDNYDFSNLSDPDLAKYETLAEEMSKHGLLQRSFAQEALEVGRSESFMDKFNRWSSFFMHTSERMNRQTTAIAAYQLELNRLAKENKTGKEAEREAARVAMYETTLLNGGSSTSSAAPIAQQSNLLKAAFMFKRYGFQMAFVQFKMIREITDPKLREAALHQAVGSLGFAALFAGVRGMPLMGTVALAYNLFKDDDEEDFYTMLRKSLPEIAISGVFDGLLNLGIGGRISQTDLIIRESKGPEAASFAEAALNMGLGPIYGVFSRVQRGYGLINEGHYLRGMESILPVSAGNVLKGVRYALEGATTKRGDPIIEDVTPWNVAGQLLGFAPADYNRQLEVTAALKGIEKAAITERTKLANRYALAKTVGDADEMEAAREGLTDLFNRHPDFGKVREFLERSERARKEGLKKSLAGVRYGQLYPELRKLAEELEED